MSKETKPIKRRNRPRNAATIVKAAKEHGAATVTFPDGTVVSFAPQSADTGGPMIEVDRYFEKANARSA